MNKNQFLYTRKQPKPLKVEGKEQEFDEFQDSFNLNCVVRAVTYPDGTVVVILNDFHEEVIEKPQINTKTNVITYTKSRETVQSQIQLSKEDGARFFKLTNIEQ